MKAIFFKAYYCGACNVIWDEIMEPLADEGYSVEEMDATKRPAFAERYRVKKIPTVVIVEGNRPLYRLEWPFTKEEIRDHLTK